MYVIYLFSNALVIILNIHDNKCMCVSPSYLSYASDMLIYIVLRGKHFKVHCLVQVLQLCLALMGVYDVEKMFELSFFTPISFK